MKKTPSRNPATPTTPANDNAYDLIWLEQFLASYGSQQKHWPAQYLATARHLIRKMPQARHLLESHARLDELLQTMPAPPQDKLAQRILNHINNTNRPQQKPSENVVARLASMLAAAMILGLVFGSTSNQAAKLTHELFVASPDEPLNEELATFVAFIE